VVGAAEVVEHVGAEVAVTGLPAQVKRLPQQPRRVPVAAVGELEAAEELQRERFAHGTARLPVQPQRPLTVGAGAAEIAQPGVVQAGRIERVALIGHATAGSGQPARQAEVSHGPAVVVVVPAEQPQLEVALTLARGVVQVLGQPQRPAQLRSCLAEPAHAGHGCAEEAARLGLPLRVTGLARDRERYLLGRHEITPVPAAQVDLP